LRDRFQLREHLEFYSDLELTEIVSRNARKLSVTIEPEAASIIAQRSRGTPRVANNRLRCVRDYVTSKADGHITCQLAEDALKMWGVDQRGLDKQDRKYLETLIRVFDGGPVGIESLAHTMNTATDTLSDDIEPYLLRSELLVRSPRGRMATTAAWQHLQLTPQDTPQEDNQDTLFD
jgi:Holliday junction DNA helicase RuvB